MKTIWTLILLVAVSVAAFAVLLFATGEAGALSALALACMFGGMIPISIAMLIDPAARRYRHLESDPTATLTIGRSTGRTIARTLMFGGLAAGTLIMVLKDTTDITNWLVLSVFVVFAVLMPFRPQVTLTLSPEGLNYSLFKTGTIAWTDVRDARLERYFLNRFIVLDVREPDKYLGNEWRAGLARRPHLTRRFPSPFLIQVMLLDAAPEWLLNVIRARIPRPSGSPHVPSEIPPT
jgi:hypothetical protein